MQKIAFIIGVLVLASASVWYSAVRTDEPFSPTTAFRLADVHRCDQGATTTDCAGLEKRFPSPSAPQPTTLPEIVWRTHENKELAISFAYPTKSISPENWGIVPGTTGRSFGATIFLPSGAVIYAQATTRDYSLEKDGLPVSTEGFVEQNGSYHIIDNGTVSDISFTPDEILTLSDGSLVPLVYGKRYDKSLDYPDPPIKAMVNLPGPTFTGMGFVLFNAPDVGFRPAGPNDIELFKQIVTSVTFIR